MGKTDYNSFSHCSKLERNYSHRWVSYIESIERTYSCPYTTQHHTAQYTCALFLSRNFTVSIFIDQTVFFFDFLSFSHLFHSLLDDLMDFEMKLTNKRYIMKRQRETNGTSNRIDSHRTSNNKLRQEDGYVL